MNLTKLIGSFNFKKFSKASRTDFGVLKVAFMVAALDGEVTEAEYKALDALAKKCLDHACDIVGSHRITAISHNINEDPFWSFFILNRRQIKTECLILAPKK